MNPNWARKVEPPPPAPKAPEHSYKATKNAAQYEHPASPAHRGRGEVCGRCTMFVLPNACRSVAGYIRQQDYCKFFERKN